MRSTPNTRNSEGWTAILRSGIVATALATRKLHTARLPDRRQDKIAVPKQRGAIQSEKLIEILVAERRGFHRFLLSRVGSESVAEDLLQDCLLKALKNGGTLRRGESAIAWFYRVLRNAVTDCYRQRASEQRRADRLAVEMGATDEAKPLKALEAAVCACFRGLLPSLKPRYAELIRRIDLNGEQRTAVARDLKIKPATMDVALHRARGSLRKRLEAFCGPCSREKCVACFCAEEKV